jgi:hypothetical protein
MNTEKKYVLSLTTKTWSRDSHGLYDYESNQTKNASAIIVENATISRRKMEIRSISSQDDLKEEEYLMDIKHDKGKL